MGRKLPPSSQSPVAPSQDSLGSLTSVPSETASAARHGHAQGKIEANRLQSGQKLGRYVILHTAGQGAMGVVYGAYDPVLDRRVAIKVLRFGPQHGLDPERDAATRRLLREAQAMAQLSHPNVLPVFDVGIADDRVFLATEFVQGKTVSEWLDAQARGWRDVVRVFRAAGAGLQAAHQAGLVHRDFKPQNVLISNDDSVHVTDFGLARRIDPEADPYPEPAWLPGDSKRPRHQLATASDPPAPASSDPPATRTRSARPHSDSPLSENLTGAGAVMGTLPYVAPELERGQPASASSDQYAFCVSLYEALYRQRPFRGRRRALCRAKASEAYAELDAEASKHVPEWLRAIVVRGLRANSDARWPSMAALLQALGHDPAQARRKRLRSWFTATLLAMAVGLTTAVAVRSARRATVSAAQLCSDANDKLASVWNPNRARALHAALIGTSLTRATQSSQRVERRLQTYANEWVTTHHEVCELTRVRGEQSEALMDLRTACLDRRLDELSALVDVLAEANPTVVDNAVRAAATLTPVATCTDPQVPHHTPPPPAVAAEVARLERQLARFWARYHVGNYEHAARLGAPLVRAANRLGYEPLQARAFLAQGKSLERSPGKLTEATEHYAAAMMHAEAAGMLREKVAASTALVFVMGYLQGRPEEAWFIARQAGATLRRLGGDHLLEASLASGEGMLERESGDSEAAAASLAKAAGSTQRAKPDHPTLVALYNNLGEVQLQLRRYDEASVALTKALKLGRTILGPAHPDLSYPYVNWGTLLMERGRDQQAAVAHRQALRLCTQAGMPDHPQALAALTLLSELKARQGAVGEARALALRARAGAERSFGPGHVRMGLALLAQAEVERRAGALDAAVDLYRQVIEHGQQKPGHGRAARRELRRRGLHGLGECLLEGGRIAEALTTLEQAHQTPPRRSGPDSALAFALARALDAADQEPERARELARRAHAALNRTQDPQKAALRELIAAWLTCIGHQPQPPEREVGDRCRPKARRTGPSDVPTSQP